MVRVELGDLSCFVVRVGQIKTNVGPLLVSSDQREELKLSATVPKAKF